MKVISETTFSVTDEGYIRNDFQRNWWRLFQKRVVHTNFDIYGFIKL